MTMDPKGRRVEMLLKIRQQEEDAARRAFDEANARASFLRQRLTECERLLVEQGQAARGKLLGGQAPADAGTYRRCVADLRSGIAEQAALLRQLEPMLQTCRRELLEAMNRRKLAQMLRDRLTGREAARREQAETARLDEAHAARTAGAPGMESTPEAQRSQR